MMRLCFIIEEQYKHDSMPLVVARRLIKQGHTVHLLEPSKMVTSLFDLATDACDAYVLKTVSDGPGLSILHAAEVAGIPTINNTRAIRLVRDKTISIALAHAHGLPVPRSYFLADPRLLNKIPRSDYPLVVKPTNGSSGRGIYRVNRPDELAALQTGGPRFCFFLAQQYVDNPGYDIKLYVIGHQIYAVARRSPLHAEVEIERRAVRVQPEWRRLALSVGKLFGLDIYGLDLLETDNGPVIVDINDFPGFGGVPEAARRVADYILQLAQDSRLLQRVGDRKPLVRGGRSETGVAVRADDYEPYGPSNGARPETQRAGCNGTGKTFRLPENALRAGGESRHAGANSPEILPPPSSGSGGK